jgi:hypothetical protein
MRHKVIPSDVRLFSHRWALAQTKLSTHRQCFVIIGGVCEMRGMEVVDSTQHVCSFWL